MCTPDRRKKTKDTPIASGKPKAFTVDLKYMMGPRWKYFFKAHLGVINPEVRNTAYIIIHLLQLDRLYQNKAAILQGRGMDN